MTALSQCLMKLLFIVNGLSDDMLLFIMLGINIILGLVSLTFSKFMILITGDYGSPFLEIPESDF